MVNKSRNEELEEDGKWPDSCRCKIQVNDDGTLGDNVCIYDVLQ